MKTLKLTAQEIENKAFNVEFKGYSPLEVDTYLDDILADYDTFAEVIKNLEAKIENYQRIVDELSNENKMLHGKLASVQESGSSNNSQVDLIRRVARLEEIVFNHR